MTINRSSLSYEGKQAILSVCYEYLLITVPIGIYVSLEAIHKNDLKFCWSSPEWAIATIFLSFQSLSLYRQNLNKTGLKISEAAFGLFGLIALLLTVIASINAYQSLHDNTVGSIRFRLVLLGITSVAFILLVGGARLVYLRMEQEKNG